MIVKNIFRRINYKTKIILCYLLVISIPYTIGLIYLYDSIVTSAQTNLIHSIENRMFQEETAVNAQLRTIEHTTYFFSTNSLLNRFFTPNYYSDIQLVESINNTVMPLMSWMEASTRDIGSFRFFTPNDSIPENEFFIQLEPYKDEPWMKQVLERAATEDYVYEPIHASRHFLYSNPYHDKVFSVYYPLLGTNLTSPTYLEVDILPRQLFSNLNTTPVAEDGVIICLSDSGEEITNMLSSESERELLQNEELLAVITEPHMSGQFSTSTTNYFVSSRRIPKLEATLLSIVPMKTLNEPVMETIRLFVFIVISLTLLLLGLSYIVSTLLLRRVHKMQKAVHKMQEGDFDVHIPVSGNDEIDDLARSMNTMSIKINDLINTVYKAEVRQKETEIMALHAQINPHFLFNTLETFRMMAELEDMDQLADSIAMLGNLMRYNIAIDKHLVTLQDELNIIEDYVNIQNLLHNNRIALHCSIPPQFLTICMPNLILQPLIENNILHGLDDSRSKIEIEVSIQELPSSFLVSVCDNGIGATPEELEIIRQKMNGSQKEEKRRRSIGLTNVNQRLILYFGQESALLIDSVKEEGFQIRFHIPK